MLQILFLRGVYPPAAFCCRRKYGVPCWMSEHPAVAEYVARHCSSLRDALLARQRGRGGADRGGPEGAEVVLSSGREEVAERYVVEWGDAEESAR